MTVVPPSLLEVADRVEVRLSALLDGERARWSALDPDLDAPYASLQSLVLSGGKRLRPAFAHWGFVGAGGEPGRPSVDRRRRGLRAAPRLRPVPRRRDGRLVHPTGRPHDPPELRRRPRVGRLARRGPALRRGRGHPGRRPGLRLRRPAPARRLGAGPGDVERAAHRAERRPVPRHPRHGQGPAEPRGGAAHRPLQVRQVHRRAAAAPGRPARRARAGRPSWSRRCRPTGSRWATPSSSATTCSAPSATRPLTGKPVGDDLREGKPTPLLAIATGRGHARPRPRCWRVVGRARPVRRRRRGRPGRAGRHGRAGRAGGRDRRLTAEALDALDVAPHHRRRPQGAGRAGPLRGLAGALER